MISRLLHFIILFSFTFLTAKELEEVTLRLQWKHQFEFAGFYAAKEQGIYEKYGIKVDILEYENGLDLIEEVNLNKVDFGVWGSGVIEQAINGKDVLLLANYFKRAPLSIITQPEIKYPKDLEGKKLMIPKSDINSANYKKMFNATNVDITKIEMIDPTFNLDDFINKKVDAVSIFLTNEPYILGQKNIKYNILDPSAYGVVLYDVNLFTSNKMYDNNPELVEKFVKASNEGWQYALDNQNEIIELILKKYNTQNKTKEHLQFEAKETVKMMQSDAYPVGSLDLEQINRIKNIFDELGMLDEINDIDSIILQSSKIMKNRLELTKDELQYIKNKKSLNVCIDNSSLPLNKLHENGFYEGLSADFINLISNKIGLNYETITTENRVDLINKIKSNECDLTSVMGRFYDKQNILNFTTPLVFFPYVIVSKDDKQIFVENLNSFSNKKIAIADDEKLKKILKIRYPNMNFIISKNIEETYNEILNGNIYAYVDNVLSVTYNIHNLSSYELSIIGKLKLANAEYSIGISKDNNELISIIEKSLNSISKNEIQKIKNKWINVNIKNKDYLSYFFKLVFVFLVALLIIIYINYRLKMKIEEQVKELRKKDNLIMEQARFYTIGQTIGNIAHQWKIPITHIGMVATSMEVTLKHGSKERYLENSEANLNKISNSIEQLKNTLDDFLNYYTTRPSKKEFNLHDSLQNNVITLLKNKIVLKNVSIKFNFDSEFKINTLEHIIANIFMILFDNSLDAFKNIEDNKIILRVSEDENNYYLEYEDNAGGIKVEPIEKIFEYFVTTKDEEGHGLGLTTLKMLLEERLKGEIKVRNLNDGVLFNIKIPK